VRVGVDIGGTFTDLVALDEDGELRVGKALNRSEGPQAGLADAAAAAGVGLGGVTAGTHGTTHVTNQLVERRGARVGLLCTRGFRDVLEIQRSFRARGFDVSYVKRPPLVPRRRRLEIGGRASRTSSRSPWRSTTPTPTRRTSSASRSSSARQRPTCRSPPRPTSTGASASTSASRP
jgi:N-methylhydantoinase A